MQVAPAPQAMYGTRYRVTHWLFIGEAEAGQRSAIIFTVIECCRRRGIDPYAYLRDVLTRLPTATNWQINDLTPEAWAKAQRTIPLSRAA